MLKESQQAAQCITRLMCKEPNACTDTLDQFEVELAEAIEQRISQCWYSNEPLRGSARRVIAIQDGRLDSMLKQLSERHSIDCAAHLPGQLWVFVDPCQVCYRIGEYGQLIDVAQAISPEVARATRKPGKRAIAIKPANSIVL